ncbi:hypothetical protein LEMLEM_LOCUS12243, partial [Lemmus lemmus]
MSSVSEVLCCPSGPHMAGHASLQRQELVSSGVRGCVSLLTLPQSPYKIMKPVQCQEGNKSPLEKQKPEVTSTTLWREGRREEGEREEESYVARIELGG